MSSHNLSIEFHTKVVDSSDTEGKYLYETEPGTTLRADHVF